MLRPFAQKKFVIDIPFLTILTTMKTPSSYLTMSILISTDSQLLKYIHVYTMMGMLRALWLVVVHDLLEYRYMDDVTGNLFSLFCSTWHGFENVCEIISDWGKWKLRKKFSRSYLRRRKMEKGRPKKLLTTWQCLNYKKSSQQLWSCVFATRDSLFCKMFSLFFFFEQEKTVKNFSKKLYTSKIKKKLRWKVRFGT